MNGKISEHYAFESQLFGASTLGQTGALFDMQNFNRALLVADVNSTLGIKELTADLMQSSNASVAGSSAAGGKTGITIGSSLETAITVSAGAREIILSPATVAAGIVLGYGTVTKTFTASSLATAIASSYWTDTAITFGSTAGVDSTADTGLQLRASGLKYAIEHAKGFAGVLQCSTPSTVQVLIKVKAGYPNITFASSSTTVAKAVVSRAAVAFEIGNDELTSTAGKRFVGLNLTTAGAPSTYVSSINFIGETKRTMKVGGVLSS